MTIKQLVEKAFEQQMAGNIPEAERLYLEALDIDPDNFDALHLLGMMAHQIGRNDIAAELIESALQSKASPVAFNNLGQVYRALGQTEEATRCYREAIALNPHYLTAFNNLGAILQESGKAAEAESVYRQALAMRPDFVEVWCNLANALQDLGKPEEAEQACRKALSINPGFAAAHNILGGALQNLGRLDEAEQAFRQALLAKPDYAMAYNNLGTLLHALGRVVEAEQAYRQAVAIEPNLAMAYNNLGALLRSLARLEESEEALRRSLALMPYNAGAYNNLAVTLKERGLLDEAKEAAVRAVALNPGSANAYSNLGVINMGLGLFEEAVWAFRQALTLDAENGDAHFNLALLDLQKGNFHSGWDGYAWRFRIKQDPHEQLPIPRYDGSKPDGKTIFVYAEQAVGEELMFSSCLGDLIVQAGQCIVECDARLVPLFSRSFPSISAIAATGRDSDTLPEALAHADFKLPLGSLPRYFRNCRDDFKGHAPWLIPGEEALQKWRSRYDALGEGLKLGISWRGGIKKDLSRMRSTSLLQWAALLSIPGVQFVNLQYGDTSGELRELGEQLGIHVHSWDDADQLRDLDDFAAQVAALDLVISIDNTTAHMAGAVGVPVWCLVPIVPNWRWMLECDDSPWYPSMKLFRQKNRHEWDHVFSAVAEALGHLVDQQRSSRPEATAPAAL
jgi:tetratricopeptide (TPR) repeat protein